MARATKAKAAPSTSLVLRVCRANGTSRDGFKWPDEIGAEIVAPDWENTSSCGNGLHGWLFGQGEHDCVDYWEKADARWYVPEVPSDVIVMLGGKCKFPRATVRFIGDKVSATNYLVEHEPRAANVAVIGLVRQVGGKQAVQVGALGTATAGNDGTATAGNDGTATAGNDGTATAGNDGEIRIRWWDAANRRYRTVIGYVGEEGIKANVAYRLNDSHKFEEVLK